ncbi:hypothetical protein ABZU32_23320 [Sphaerisporangium sp. NPDC005288]|uniref:hypothetical protein n=1 Tax=Sphaerisporangium sp. NPDC005288 TaxID=3155114 RepID=UPI0033B573C0
MPSRTEPLRLGRTTSVGQARYALESVADMTAGSPGRLPAAARPGRRGHRRRRTKGRRRAGRDATSRLPDGTAPRHSTSRSSA